MYNEMSVMLISVSHDTVVSNKHEERTRHYYVIFQQPDPVQEIQRLSAQVEEVLHCFLLLALVGLFVQQLYVHL